MKFYHGSIRKLKVLKPQNGKGEDKFENQKAIFLTPKFTQAALYAIGKTLKKKTSFALHPNKLVIVGNLLPGNGYVYEVNIPDNEVEKGPWNQYVYKKEIKNFKVHTIDSQKYKNKIIYVKNKETLIKYCDIEKLKQEK
ncbi:MAG: hypothetical protein Q7R52_00055 [archaeon]|nr:hypothetical protein [archaeon]